LKVKVIRPLAGAVALATVPAAPLVHAEGSPAIIQESLKITVYDGIIDDLLSAGLNQAGLISSTPPGFADP
jgi:hypothetical protein